MVYSERFVCIYVFIISLVRMLIRIIKNFRVCGDCYNVFKIILKFVGR